MRDKMVRDRRKSCLSIESSVEIHGADVASDLEEFFADKLQEGETMPPFLIILQFLQRLLTTACEGLVGAAAEHLTEIDGDNKARRRRDVLKERLAVKGRRLRDVLDGLFGRGAGLELAGLDRRTAQETVDLVAQTERIIERYSAIPTETLRPDLAGFSIDPAAMIADIQPDHDEYHELVEELNRENRRSDATLIAKNEAMEKYDLTFRLVAGILSAYYTLAGHEELARRVTPSTRRSGRTVADTAGEEKGEEQQPAVPGEQPAAAVSEAAG